MDKATLDALVERSQQPIQPKDGWLDELFEMYSDQVATRLNYYRFLYWLVKEIKPAVVLEMGVETGVASAHMARAASDYGGVVIGVDPVFHPTPAGQIPAMCKNYIYYIGSSISLDAYNVVRHAIEDHGLLGLVFQDSSHHSAPSEVEWGYYSPFVTEGGVWVCDDITSAFKEEGVDDKSMEEYFDNLPWNKVKYPNVLHRGNTIGVLWR